MYQFIVFSGCIIPHGMVISLICSPISWWTHGLLGTEFWNRHPHTEVHTTLTCVALSSHVTSLSLDNFTCKTDLKKFKSLIPFQRITKISWSSRLNNWKPASHLSFPVPTIHVFLNLGWIFSKRVYCQERVDWCLLSCSLSFIHFSSFNMHYFFSDFSIFGIDAHHITSGSIVID